MSINRIIDLTVKELSSTISQEEKKELETLLRNNDDNKKVYEEAKTTWEKSKEFKSKVIVDAEASWLSFRKKVEKKPQTKIFALNPFYRVAAAIIIAIGIGIAVYNPWSSSMYITGEGEILEVVLADNSVITLNEYSSLTVSSTFNDEIRLVEFEGEAYFDITENPEKPFIIESKTSEIQVLGTSFNVDARKGLGFVEVDVTSGRVSLSESGRISNQIILTAGMKGTYNSLSKEMNSFDSENENFQSWRTDLLVFDDLRMNKVLSDMEDYFDVTISAQNKAILNCTFTSTFSKPEIEEVMEILSLTLDLEYQENADVYTLMGEGCKEVQK